MRKFLYDLKNSLIQGFFMFLVVCEFGTTLQSTSTERAATKEEFLTNLVLWDPCCSAWGVVLVVHWSRFPFPVAFSRQGLVVHLDILVDPWTVDSASSDCELERQAASVEIAEMMDVLEATVEVKNSVNDLISFFVIYDWFLMLPGRILEPLDRLVILHSLVIDPVDSALDRSSKKNNKISSNLK